DAVAPQHAGDQSPAVQLGSRVRRHGSDATGSGPPSVGRKPRSVVMPSVMVPTVMVAVVLSMTLGGNLDGGGDDDVRLPGGDAHHRHPQRDLLAAILARDLVRRLRGALD